MQLPTRQLSTNGTAYRNLMRYSSICRREVSPYMSTAARRHELTARFKNDMSRRHVKETVRAPNESTSRHLQEISAVYDAIPHRNSDPRVIDGITSSVVPKVPLITFASSTPPHRKPRFILFCKRLII